MTSDLATMLIGPLTALVGAALMTAFIMWRIHRYGYVFKWPDQPSPRTPPVTRPGDK